MSKPISNGPWFDFQPGNGTRYKIFAMKVDPDNLGFNVIVCWLKNGDMGGPSFRFSDGGHIDLYYFMEKTGITNEHDASAIMLFCQLQFGVTLYGIPDEVRQRDWWRKHF